MNLARIVVFLFLSLNSTARAAEYPSDAKVQLHGTLVQPTCRPEESGDEKAHKFYAIKLLEPVSLRCNRGEDECTPAKGQTVLQLALSGKQGIALAKKLLGKNVTVIGSVFAQFSGHHFTKILIDVKDIQAH